MAGKIKVIGIANFEIEHQENLMRHTSIPPMVNQIEAHPEFPQYELRAYMDKHHILHEAWGPLGQGNKTLLSYRTSKDSRSPPQNGSSNHPALASGTRGYPDPEILESKAD
ncbi:hypothetical protein PAECIP111890_02637 [Paenibacillus sp. JJ-223]|nr:hypothetical protein PAECIP111890_02637 [Paenibacillus sp. JJ-223]